MPESDPLAFRIVALGILLMRRCLGSDDAGDDGSARAICREIAQMDTSRKILAVASGGVWAAYGPPEEIDDDDWNDLIGITRIFLRSDTYDGLMTLSSAALILMVDYGKSGAPSEDLLLAAESAWKIEHHGLAIIAARAALAAEISAHKRIVALSLIARITNSVNDIEVVQREVANFAADTDDVDDLEPLVSEFGAAASGGYAAALEALTRGERAQAARHFAVETHRLLEIGRDPEAIGGMERAFTAMSSEDIDVPELRSALTLVVRHLRTRQRFGSVPPAVRAALNLVIVVLRADSNPAMASVLVELMEALADAGLSDITLESDQASPAVIEAQLSDTARDFKLWPSLQVCVDGLGEAWGLICRSLGRTSTTETRWLTALIVPPNGVFVDSRRLTSAAASTLDALATYDPDTIARIELAELDDLVRNLIPQQANDYLNAQRCSGLVIVPEGPLWNVPWQAAPILRDISVSLAPSLTIYQRLAPPLRHVHHVAALIDDTVDDAELLIDELFAARASGALSVDFAPAAISRECDLLVVLAHGAGSGLRFEAAVTGGSINAYELAQRADCRSAIIAACWSAKSPPLALPLNLQTSLLLQGCSYSLGGAWPLPQANTARFIARVISAIARGESLQQAVGAARSLQTSNLFESWGLISTGRLEDVNGGDWQ